MDRVRGRIEDRRILGLIKAFLKAGVLNGDDITRYSDTGTPQGGILSPLLANIALSALDDHVVGVQEAVGRTHDQRMRRRRKGLANYRLVRYADDFVVLVAGTRAQAEALQEETAAVLRPMGLRLSPLKTGVCHIDEGFDFLGFRIQRHRKRGTAKQYVYVYPSKAALAAVKAKVRAYSHGSWNQPLRFLLDRLNPVLRGWTAYFRHGVSKATFGYLGHFTWYRVISWLRRKHRSGWKKLRRRYLPEGWPTDGGTVLFNPGSVPVTRYRYRGAAIPSPWAERA